MKKVLFLLLALLLCLTVSAEKKVASYSMSYFDNIEYDVETTDIKNGKFTYYIYTASSDGKNGKCGFSLESSKIEKFIECLRTIIPKYEEWTKTAQDNKVTDFDKNFGVKFPSTDCFFLYGSKWCFNNGWKFMPYFKVTKNGDCLLVFHVGKIQSATNQFMTSKGWYMVFSNVKEIEEFINAIDPSHATENSIEQDKKDALFN